VRKFLGLGFGSKFSDENRGIPMFASFP